MSVEKAYRFRLYPNKEQHILIQKTFGCTRFVYNHYLALRQQHYQQTKQTLNYNACSKDLTQLKRQLDWLREVDSTALQTSLKHMDAAFSRFFGGLKKGQKVGFPKFKSKHGGRKAFTSKMNIRVLDNAIHLPKLGRVACEISRPIQGRPVSMTVSQGPSGKYHVSILCLEVTAEPYKKTGRSVGIDLGIKELVVTSNGQHIPNPKFYSKAQKSLAKAQRRLSRKQKGSRNRQKANVKVAILHERIQNQRRDACHKLTTRLVRDHDLIAVETLKIKNMVRNRKLAKAIHDVAWGEVIRQLSYKCDWYGKELVQINTFYPSSQTCSSCGHQNPAVKDLGVRRWICPACGANHDRDENAAKNILAKGLQLTA